jgi:hypothetical protein
MPVTPEEVTQTAQCYLDAYLPEAQAEDDVDAFYGYYTIHVVRDSETIGMLSVNGYARRCSSTSGMRTLLTWLSRVISNDRKG